MSRITCLMLGLALLATSAASAQPLPERVDVIVVGGGPAGLAAATEAALRGARVVVLERYGEERTRPQILMLEEGEVAELNRQGVDTSRFSPIGQITVIDADGRTIESSVFQVRAPPHPSDTEQPTRGGLMDLILRRSPVSAAQTKELEAAQLPAARRAGVRVEFETRAETVSVGKDEVSVEFTRKDGSTGTLRASYLVVAAGSRGGADLLSQLGVRTLTLPGTLENTAYGLFEQRGEGLVLRRLANTTLNGLPGPDSIASLAAGEHTYVAVKLPADLHFASKEQLADYLRAAAEQAGVRGPLVQEPVSFQSSFTRASKTVVGERVFIIGDAARTTTPRVALGLNLALRDGFRFGRLYETLSKTRSAFRARLARLWFSLRTRMATHAVHAVAAPLVALPRLAPSSHLSSSRTLNRVVRWTYRKGLPLYLRRGPRRPRRDGLPHPITARVIAEPKAEVPTRWAETARSFDRLGNRGSEGATEQPRGRLGVSSFLGRRLDRAIERNSHRERSRRGR